MHRRLPGSQRIDSERRQLVSYAFFYFFPFSLFAQSCTQKIDQYFFSEQCPNRLISLRFEWRRKRAVGRIHPLAGPIQGSHHKILYQSPLNERMNALHLSLMKFCCWYSQRKSILTRSFAIRSNRKRSKLIDSDPWQSYLSFDAVARWFEIVLCWALFFSFVASVEGSTDVSPDQQPRRPIGKNLICQRWRVESDSILE